ncbi:hypothetical protein DYE48_09490 [Halobacillus trueperi]|uniref:Uncharacterized protein n=1 Tax=Halobacillus trueperi TaxID=156205 RepID=A0A3E0J8P0_9BACI|nr:hypothetical protein DYE48_09490 [Halobacillus trueperi]
MGDTSSRYRGSYLPYIEWGGWEARHSPTGKRVASQPPLTPNTATNPGNISKLSLPEKGALVKEWGYKKAAR